MTSTTRRSEQGRQQCSSFLSVRRLNIEFFFNCGVSVLISFDLAMPNLPDHCYQCNSNACSGQLIGPYWYYYRVAWISSFSIMTASRETVSGSMSIPRSCLHRFRRLGTPLGQYCGYLNLTNFCCCRALPVLNQATQQHKSHCFIAVVSPNTRLGGALTPGLPCDVVKVLKLNRGRIPSS